MGASEERLAEIRRRIVRAVLRVCPSWLSEYSEDIVQTAMLRILEVERRRVEGEPDLSPLYLEKAANSATVDEIRRHLRRREHPAEEARELRSHRSDANPESIAAARE